MLVLCRLLPPLLSRVEPPALLLVGVTIVGEGAAGMSREKDVDGTRVC